MIIKNGKNISAIFKGSTPIVKVYKGLQVIWESFKKLVVSGIPPLTFSNSIGAPLIDYKIYGNSKQAILPDEYQQVEYIETTGTQYFDTGVPLVSGIKMVVDWVYTDASSGNSYTGGHIGSPGNRWLVGSQRNGKYYFAVGTSNLATEFTFGNRDVVEAYWADRASYIKVNGVKSTSVDFTSYVLGNEPNYTFFLGATNRNGSPASIPRLIIFGGEFYKDDNFIRNYVTCYRKADGKIGIYDLVNAEFCPSLGTGEPLKGPDVPSPNAPLAVQSVSEVMPISVNGDITTINATQPLCKVGEYADYIDYRNGNIVRKVGVKTFDGSENWELHKENKDNVVYRLDGVLTPKLNVPTSATYMTHFILTNIYSTGSFTAGLYRFGFDQDNLTITSTRLYVSSDQMTLAEFKAWLAENKPTIFYPLATPIEESIVLPEIPTIKGTNIIDVDTEIKPSNVEITYKGAE